ncbi:DUF1516 family protein [Halobacillus hunanensis]|uniref:DUF1516 family protein n=1 Tax=Halobacillus hunanensis TaxID=578214 RepID=UPI0009A70F01|nr:DUF1516 family protein [Halobacillus hunanensis]
MIIHLHLAVVIIIIGLLITVNHLYNIQKNRTAIILHYILRASFVAAVLSGGFSLGMQPVSLGSLFKVFLGISSIGLIEMYFMHKSKNDTPRFLPALLIIFLGLTVITGLILPLGLSF